MISVRFRSSTWRASTSRPVVDFCAQRRGPSLIPVTASDEQEILRIPERRVINVTVSVPAPPKIARWYRAGVQLLVEATGRWPNRDLAHAEIMMKAGFFESFVISTHGDVRYTPKSTAGWGLVEWREYLDKALPVMLVYAGETRAQFRDRVDRFFGIKFQEAWAG